MEITHNTNTIPSGLVLFGGPVGKTLRLVREQVTVDEATSSFTAANFSMSKLLMCSGIVDADGNSYSGSIDANGNNLLIQGTSTEITTLGVKQVETATVVAASGATGDGDLDVTITSALFDEDEVVTVALLTATHTSAALIAEAIRTALAANTNVAANYTVGGSTTSVVLTAINAAANDATLNIAIEGTLGVTAVTSSTNTTAGVATVGSVTTTSSSLAAGTYYISIIGY